MDILLKKVNDKLNEKYIIYFEKKSPIYTYKEVFRKETNRNEILKRCFMLDDKLSSYDDLTNFNLFLPNNKIFTRLYSDTKKKNHENFYKQCSKNYQNFENFYKECSKKNIFDIEFIGNFYNTVVIYGYINNEKIILNFKRNIGLIFN